MNRQIAIICAIFLVFSRGVAVDKVAIVIGNGQGYVEKARLAGPPEDADLMRSVLEKRGFYVVPGGKECTMQAIKDLFRKAQDAPGIPQSGLEQFVFYYAGHGTRAGKEFALVTVDPGRDGRNLLGNKDLRDLILKVKSRSYTVILDSCFSGGMSKSDSDIKTRYWEPEDSISKGVLSQEEFAAQERQDFIADRGICYVTATSSAQLSTEVQGLEPNKFHGVFTYFLADTLRTMESKMPSWGDVCEQIGSKITKRLKLMGKNVAQIPQVKPDSYRDLTPLTVGEDKSKFPFTPKEKDDLVAISREAESADPSGLPFKILSPSLRIRVGEFIQPQIRPSGEKMAWPVLLALRDGEPTCIWPPAQQPQKATESTHLWKTLFPKSGVERLKCFYFENSKDQMAFRKLVGEKSSAGSDFDFADLSKKIKRTVDVSFVIEPKLFESDQPFADLFESFRRMVKPPLATNFQRQFVVALANVVSARISNKEIFTASPSKLFEDLSLGKVDDHAIDSWCGAINLLMQNCDFSTWVPSEKPISPSNNGNSPSNNGKILLKELEKFKNG